MPDLPEMTLSNFSGDFWVKQQLLPRVHQCEALPDKGQRACRNLGFPINAQPFPTQWLCEGGSLPPHLPWGLTWHDRSVTHSPVKCDIQQVCCDAALTVIEEQNSICKSFCDSSTPIKHDKKICQKLFCPRKEGGLAPGHQMRRKGTASSWQWAPAATPGRLPSHLNSELQQPLHSVLGSKSCSHCLAVALWDSLGTTGLTACSLPLLCWAWHGETQCAKAKSSFSQWQKCLCFLSWT